MRWRRLTGSQQRSWASNSARHRGRPLRGGSLFFVKSAAGARNPRVSPGSEPSGRPAVSRSLDRRSLIFVVTVAAALAAPGAASAAVVKVRNDTLADAQLEPWDITATQDHVTVSRLDVLAGRRERLDLRVTVSGSKRL